MPANGVGAATQLTTDGKVLRWDGIPSPDGKHIAHYDKDQQLWVCDIEHEDADQGRADARDGDFADVAGRPTAVARVHRARAESADAHLWLRGGEPARVTPVTTDRYDSYSPAWSPDGKWLYFLSDRHFESVVRSPWGSRQPEPFFDKQTKIYQVSLKPGERSPFRPDDELYVAPKPTSGKSDKADQQREGCGQVGR